MGRVEVNYLGEWGTVCHNRWSMNDGHVVCRMLGFPKAEQIFKSAELGSGSGPIWLTKLLCNGTEKSLFDCKNAEKYLGDTGCTHDQDAGVKCLEEDPGKIPHAFMFLYSVHFVFGCILAVYSQGALTSDAKINKK